MTTLTDMLDDLVQSAFSATQKSKSLTDAALVLKVTAADSDAEDMAIALYATQLLKHARAVVQNASNPAIQIPTLSISPEIERLLSKDDASTATTNLIYFTANSTSKHWSSARS